MNSTHRSATMDGKRKLTGNLTLIKETLSAGVDPVCDKLIERDIIPWETKDELDAIPGSQKKVDHILKRVISGGKESYQAFIEVLQACGYTDLAGTIEGANTAPPSSALAGISYKQKDSQACAPESVSELNGYVSMMRMIAKGEKDRIETELKDAKKELENKEIELQESKEKLSSLEDELQQAKSDLQYECGRNNDYKGYTEPILRLEEVGISTNAKYGIPETTQHTKSIPGGKRRFYLAPGHVMNQSNRNQY